MRYENGDEASRSRNLQVRLGDVGRSVPFSDNQVQGDRLVFGGAAGHGLQVLQQLCPIDRLGLIGQPLDGETSSNTSIRLGSSMK